MNHRLPMSPSTSTPAPIEVRMNRSPSFASTPTAAPSEVRMKSTAAPKPTKTTKKYKKPRRREFRPVVLRVGLARELALLAPTYARLRAEHPALAPYPTLPSLLARVTTGPHDDAKCALIASLVAIRQSSPHRLWVAILMRAFWPMLAKLWKELFGSDMQERLALLVLAFQGALEHVDPIRDPVRIGMYIRQGTRRRAIVALAKEAQWFDVGFGVDADEVADNRMERAAKDQGRLRAAHAMLEAGTLFAHVRSVYTDLSLEEQTRVYQKLRRNLQQVRGAPPGRVAAGKGVMR